MREPLRPAVTGGHRLVGTVLTLPGVAAAELAAEPFDVVWVDLEHAALGPLDAQEMILGAQAAGASALVRLPSGAHDLMAMMLDAGADGVVLASVDGPEEAAAAVARVLHPPEGRRGWGPRRVALRGRHDASERAQPSVWAQIESATAVERAAAIAAVPAIDALVVGTADLSFSLGVPLDLTAPELLDAIAAASGRRERRGGAGPRNGLLAAASNADLVAVHGNAGQNMSAGATTVADGTSEAAARLLAVLDNDPALGILRHASAGYDDAVAAAEQHGIGR